MKIYVAGPMSGYPEFNYPAFEDARMFLTDLGYEVLSPTDSEQLNDSGAPMAWDWYMRHALRMVLDADGLAVLEGWELSRGARLEVEVAHALQLPVMPLLQWVARTVVSRG